MEDEWERGERELEICAGLMNARCFGGGGSFGPIMMTGHDS